MEKFWKNISPAFPRPPAPSTKARTSGHNCSEQLGMPSTWPTALHRLQPGPACRGLGGLFSATCWRPALGQCCLRCRLVDTQGGSKDASLLARPEPGPTDATSPSCEMSWSIWDWGWQGAVCVLPWVGSHGLEPLAVSTISKGSNCLSCLGPPGLDIGGHKGGGRLGRA